jgi:hypothetical protein
MELWTLGEDFQPRTIVEPYISAIWTERYTSAGDVQLQVLAPSILADELSRGRFLAMRGSKEIMVIEERTIEKGVLTATGPSLVRFFNEREAWFANPDYDPSKEFYDIPDAAIPSITDYSGTGPLTITVPEISDETYDGRTIVMALFGTPSTASPTIVYPNGTVDYVGVGGAVGGGAFSYSKAAWRLRKAGDRTFTLRDLVHPTNALNLICRVLVLRGITSAPDGYVDLGFTAGYGSSTIAFGVENAGTWTDNRRWIAWLAYNRTDLGSGHTLPAPAAISGGDSWTDNGEYEAASSGGRTVRMRTATDLSGSAAGHRPGATFHPSVEWNDPPADQGIAQIIALSRDTRQAIPSDKSSTPLYADYTTDVLSAGVFLAYIVDSLLISPVPFTSPLDVINFEWDQDAIPGLTTGPVDDTGPLKRLTFPLGPIYDGIQKLAEEQHLGFKLYLDSASSFSYILKFATYRGLDRTSNQDVRRVIRMTPDMDSLLNSKEFVSLNNYKNVVYVTYKNKVSVHYFGSTEPMGFNRRVIRVDAPDRKVAADKEAAFRNQVAWNTLLQHRQAWAVDGQVQTVSLQKFGRDYYLGDVIELEGSDGVLSIAQVTEHIRAQDQYGYKEYPTLTSIDPTLFNFDDDLRSTDLDRDWDGNPSYDAGPGIIIIPPGE